MRILLLLFFVFFKLLLKCTQCALIELLLNMNSIDSECLYHDRSTAWLGRLNVMWWINALLIGNITTIINFVYLLFNRWHDPKNSAETMDSSHSSVYCHEFPSNMSLAHRFRLRAEGRLPTWRVVCITDEVTWLANQHADHFPVLNATEFGERRTWCAQRALVLVHEVCGMSLWTGWSWTPD